MIQSVVSLLIILSFQKQIAQEPAAINQRIEFLKRIINSEIQGGLLVTTQSTTAHYDYDYKEYGLIEPDDTPIKPIIQYHDKTHKQKKRKHRNTKDKDKKKKKISRQSALTTTAKTSTVNNTVIKVTPADVYYRRIFDDDAERNKPQKWTHCLDLITPYLNGIKDNLGSTKSDMKDGTVLRLIHLISLNTTGYPKEDIVSILYQISNLPLRIFQWDVDAITSLFNVLIPRTWHDFRGLKAGVKALFQKWHLDTSNIVSFVQQSRVFRPPCIDISEIDASTKSSKSVRYTTPTTKNSDSDCDD